MNLFHAMHWLRCLARLIGGLMMVGVAADADPAGSPPVDRQSKRPCVLIAHTWSHRNIGDMTIGPGLARMLKEECGDPEVIPVSYGGKRNSELLAVTQKVWDDKFPGVTVLSSPAEDLVPLRNTAEEEMVRAVFEGRLRLLDTPLAARISPPFLAALKRSDLVLYSSGMVLNSGWEVVPGGLRQTLRMSLPLLLARELNIPYGVCGHSFDSLDGGLCGQYLTRLLSGARFILCRDPDSVKYIKECGVTAPIMDFGPDTTVFFNWSDDPWAEDFMQKNGLRAGEFAVFVPIIRWVQQKVHHHMTQAATIIEHWIKTTGMPVVLAPEVEDEIATILNELYPRLSPEAKQRTVLQTTFWTSAQARALYSRCRLLISMEHHSTLISLPMGIPTLHPYIREQGRKYSMFGHVGLGDNAFDIWQTPLPRILRRMDQICADWEAERKKTADAARILQACGAYEASLVRAALTATPGS